MKAIIPGIYAQISIRYRTEVRSGLPTIHALPTIVYPKDFPKVRKLESRDGGPD